MLPYALTIFTGAFLLFLVQPLIGKYILPWFGGGPGVWTTCMLFFQVVLVGGYAYAHLVSKRLAPRKQAVLQLVLAALALALLPITPSDAWKPVSSQDPTWHILALLAACIGVPYLVLSSTGPLMQRWFTLTEPGKSPYRLFALSNTGSLLALLGYPFFFESQFSRKTQALLWSGGFVLYALCTCAAAWRLWRTPEAPQSPPIETQRSTGRSITGMDWALWLLLPACASALLLATTNKLCLDVAVVPFLWILPLALYLLSFIVAFDNPRWYARLPFAFLLAGALGAMCWALNSAPDWPVWRQATTYGAGLFICCIVCHGELYRRRPEPRHLTAYYLLIAVGGALGGVFVALIAPTIFTDYYELPISLLACAVLFVLAANPSATDPAKGVRLRGIRTGLQWTAVGALAVTLWTLSRDNDPGIVHKSRNFYGVLTVYEYYPRVRDSHHYLLQHGRITHGLQFAEGSPARWATTYFGNDTGVGAAIQSLSSTNRRIGIVGLGTGTLATYGRDGDYIRFYEINPDVERVARKPFTYLRDSAATVEVARGDARLSMEREPAQQFDLLILDAFSSDSIPVHLLTREAMTVYEKHLKPDGLLAIHISNHYLDLEPIVARLAQHAGYNSALLDYEEDEESWWVYSATWVLLSKDFGKLNSASIQHTSRPLREINPDTPLWTDEFASLYPILIRE